jgi:hypothetical protein
VALSGRERFHRLVILVLSGIASSLVAARDANATGCHVSERPVLAHTFTWERWSELTGAAERFTAAVTPPALRPLPCQGEIPTLPTGTTVLPVPALTAEICAATTLSLERMTAEGDPHLPKRVAFRLDRPPRATSSLQVAG